MKIIPLTKGYEAVVDDDDFDRLSKFKWYCRESQKTVYAARSVMEGSIKRIVYMHRFIIAAREGMEVDHIDGNGLNNQKENLRECNRANNGHNIRVHHHNKSGLKGAWFCRGRETHRNKWMSQITINKKCIPLGRFPTALDAAMAYDAAAIKYFGDFARTNASMGLLPKTT